MKLKDLPKDPTKLKEMLAKLKDKEARLEADLAIKEHPEVESGIIAIILAFESAKRIEDTLKITIRPDAAKTAQINMIQAQITRLQNQIAAYKDQLEKLAGPDGDKLVRKNANLTEAIEVFRKTFAEWKPQFDEHHVNMGELLPGIKKYLTD